MPLKRNHQGGRTRLPVSVEGENPNLSASRHTWPTHGYTGQPFVTSNFPDATWALFKTLGHFYADQNGTRLSPLLSVVTE